LTGEAGACPPLGVYIHWPYCARICPYCDFAVVRDRGRSDEQAALGRAILRDLASQAAWTGRRRLVSIFFGGGTPSLMPPETVAATVEACRSLWPSPRPVEVTLEANPTDAESARFAAFADAGVTRLSLGVQAFDDAGLTLLGRNHDASEARRAARLAAGAFPRLSIDLIGARPGQSLQSWRADLQEAVDLGAEHVSAYELTIEEGTPFHRAVRRGRLTPPDEDAGADFYQCAQETLSGLGFEAYEVSNHSKGVDAQARHNLVYWRGEDYVGVGPSAHGRLTQNGVRTALVMRRTPLDYIAAVQRSGTGVEAKETLSSLEAARERLLMGLRISEGVDLSALDGLALDALPDLVAQGLMEMKGEKIRATPAGRAVLDAVTRTLIA